MTIEADRSVDVAPRIRLGMVGGGRDAFIGAVHRIAARLDDEYSLVAGALSSKPEKAMQSAADLGLARDRSYSDYVKMARAESEREDGIEAVVIVTPNHMHYPVAKAFLEVGIHVICDKPLTTTVDDAESLAKLARKKNRLLAVTYNYTGYPLVRHARSLIAGGALGSLRVVNVEYVQDWLSTPLEQSGQKQASWRTDPERSGVGGCIGDIGSHAYHLACFVSGLNAESICAELSTFVKGRPLDDNAQILLRFPGGARGLLWSSQVAPGNENNLSLRLYGDKGGLEWRQEDPNVLRFTPLGEATRLVTRAGPAVGVAASRISRTPAGHPEGFLEAFATIYREVAAAIRSQRDGTEIDDAVQFPDVSDGLLGVRFIAAAVESSGAGGIWRSLHA